MNEHMRKLDPKKLPLVLLVLGAVVALFLYIAAPQGKSKKTELEEVDEMPKYRIGEIINDYSSEYKITKLDFTKSSPDTFSGSLPADLAYLVITVEVKNISNKPSEIKCGKLSAVFDGKLLQYECNRRLSARTGVFSEINPQVKRTVSIYYEMPTDVLGPYVWSPTYLPRARLSIGEFSGLQLMDFRGSTRGAKEVVLSTLSDTELLTKIKQAYKVAGSDSSDGPRPPPYKYALVDLDSDGKNEIFVMRGGVYCGIAGCDLSLLKYDGDKLKLTGDSWLAGDRIWILPSKTKGMFDITLGTTRMRFNGANYEEY